MKLERSFDINFITTLSSVDFTKRKSRYRIQQNITDWKSNYEKVKFIREFLDENSTKKISKLFDYIKYKNKNKND